MMKVESVKAHLLSLHGGDIEGAYDNAVRSYLWALSQMSLGMARVSPKTRMPPKPRVEPVLLESEKTMPNGS